jgi:hypothetical protein
VKCHIVTNTNLSASMKTGFQVFMALVLFWGMLNISNATGWPKEISTDAGTIIIYQPQPEKLEGNVLTGRAAMSLEFLSGREPIFGAFWFASSLDNNGDVVIVRNIKITRVSWPDVKDEEKERFSQIVENALPTSGFEISQERLAASLGASEQEMRSLEQIKNEPPEIIFTDKVAVLLLYDGKPRFSPIDDSRYERALNTPFAVTKDTETGEFYLSSGVLWYVAGDPLGPWAKIDSPPIDLVEKLPKPENDDQAVGDAPEIVVATTPTELVSTDGKPEWKSLPDGNLLFVVNTETPWIRDISGNDMYLLLSGRWFSSDSQDGPWKFVRADTLPAPFKNIPPDSDIGGLRSSVAGTEEAEEAVLDSRVPQTAAINRKEATLEVKYDGKPEFEMIDGTSVSYAVNTAAQVLEIEGKYYAVDDGVWFVADDATGPWKVADSIPEDEISKIPPSSPVYNTTYVRIYASTPEIVYVGYTPGYLWSFPYYGVPVYGTGWYYPPYWGTYYYPRPPTWGFHVGYNPWTGWNFGVSWSNGFFRFGATWGGGWGGAYRPGRCCGGWYGGGYHRGPTFVNTGDINIGNSIHAGNRTDIGNRLENSERAANAREVYGNNLYSRGDNINRNIDQQTAYDNLKIAKTAEGRSNDIFVDRNSNIARKTDTGWQTHDGGKWKNIDALDTTITGSSSIAQENLPAASGNFGGGDRNVDIRSLERHQTARSNAGHREARMRMGGGNRRRR